MLSLVRFHSSPHTFCTPPYHGPMQFAQTVCANSFRLFSAYLKGKSEGAKWGMGWVGGTVCTNCSEIVCANCAFIFGWVFFCWVGIPFIIRLPSKQLQMHYITSSVSTLEILGNEGKMQQKGKQTCKLFRERGNRTLLQVIFEGPKCL